MTDTTVNAPLTVPIPDTTFYRPMFRGHVARTGHELAGHLASDDGGQLWRIVRTCCQAPPPAPRPPYGEERCPAGCDYDDAGTCPDCGAWR